MPFEISKYAKGLPALLGLKERGRGLPQLADQAVGVIDVGELYRLDTREFVALSNVAAAAVGANLFPDAVVPAGEVWYVWNFTAGAQPGAGAAVTLAPAVFLDQSVGAFTMGEYLSIAATELAQSFVPRPFWAGPGSQFAALVKAQTLAPAILGNLLITRLRV